MKRNLFNPYKKNNVIFILRNYFNLTKADAEYEIERLAACVVRDNLNAIDYISAWESKMNKGNKGNINELYSLYPFYQNKT